MTRQVQVSAGGACDLAYQIAWCPRYRRPVLLGAVAGRCEELIGAKARERGWPMMALAITPDHVHLFVKAHPFSCPSWIASQFKGFTTWRPQVAFAHLRSSLPALWSRSYLAAVGAVSAQTVLWFIDTQNG